MPGRRSLLYTAAAGFAAIAGCSELSPSGGDDDPDGTGPESGGNTAGTPPGDLSVSWSRGPDMPLRRTQTTAVALDGRIYVVGGIVGADGRHTAVYDPGAGRWRTAARPPDPINHSVAGRPYAAGGRRGLGPMVGATACYDPDDDVWESRAEMPTPRAGIAGAVLAGHLFVFGGEEVGERVFGEVEAYHPRTDTWTAVAPLPTPRWGLGVAALDGRIYAVGGGAVPSAQETRRLEVMTVE